jgi:dTDP-4-amino-4,6-dideoxygalactose transaminase
VVDFLDIDHTTALMNVAAATAKLEQAEREGTLPKVVLPVHLAGSSCDMAAKVALAERYGFALLEDASHAIGGRYQGEPVGNCLHSAITVCSFHPVKIITTDEGGPGHHQRSAAGPAHAGTAQPRHRARGRALSAASGWALDVCAAAAGLQLRITDIQVALGLSQLQRLDEVVVE